MGVPGLVDSATGQVDLAVNLAETSLPLSQILSDHFAIPVVIENDANAVAYGAAHFLVKEHIDNMAFVTLGTGVGSGIILDGEIYHGANNMAGEIGHKFYRESEIQCQCGLYGCLETFVAGPAISRMGQTAVAQNPTSLLAHYDTVDAAAVFKSAGIGDATAQAIVDQVGLVLARALQGLIMSFDLDQIVIGGGISRAGDTLLRPILREWHTMRQQSDMAQTMLANSKIMICPPEYRAGAWGAVAVGMSYTAVGRHFLSQAAKPSFVSAPAEEAQLLF